MRWLAALGFLATVLASPAAAAEAEVSIDGGRAPLFGVLTRPAKAASGPAVLLVAGSGPTDRDGNSTFAGVRPATLKLLAEALEAHGIPSLRYDKRAIGKSAPAAMREDDIRFSTAVDDAAAFGAFLQQQPGVSCVVIAGHSEGSLIAALAAEKIHACGVIEIAGPGRPLGVVLREQLRRQLPPALLVQVEGAIADLEAGRTTANIPGLEALLRPSVQPYLISQLAADPVQALKAVEAPVLILQGDRDLQSSMDDAQALAAARPDAKFVVLSGVNHVLKAAPADRAGNLATYADPELPLPPSVIDPIVQFVASARPRAHP